MIKKILFSTLFMMIGYSSFGQSGVYIITEKMGLPTQNEYFDELYVTDPNGTTTTYQIPHFTNDISGHDSELNSVINGIINLGYRIINADSWGTPSGAGWTGTSPFYVRTMFLGIP